MKTYYKFKEVVELVGIEGETLIQFVQKEWIVPIAPSNQASTCEFDEEDIARARLILELTSDFGVNDEAIPLILHLVDQLHGIHREIKKIR